MLAVSAAWWTGAAEAGAIIYDTFTAPTGTSSNGRSPAPTDLPGGTWAMSTYYAYQLTGNALDLNTDQAGTVALASYGPYTRPDVITLSADVEVGGLSDGGNGGGGIALGFNPTAISGSGSDWPTFIGLVLHQNGTLVYRQTGANVASVAWSGPTFNVNAYYNLSYSVNTSTGQISNIKLQGSTANYAALVTAGTGFTTAGTAYASVYGDAANAGYHGYLDNYLVSTPDTQLTWNGGGGSPSDGPGTWTSGASWWTGSSSVAWSDGNQAVFGAGSGNGAAGTGIVNVSGAVKPSGIVFNTTGDGNPYTVSGGTIDFNGLPQTITANVNASIASTITNGSLIKQGAGMLTLSGSNSYTGQTTVYGGTLRAGSSTALGSNSSVWLANAAGAVLDLNGNSVSIDSLVNGGTIGGNVTLGAGTLTVGGGAGSPAYAGVISGGGAIVVATSGGTQWLTGNNTYTGGTTVTSGGSLGIGNYSAVNGNNYPVTLNNGLLIENASNHMPAINVGASGGTATWTSTGNHGFVDYNISGTGNLYYYAQGDDHFDYTGAGGYTLSGTFTLASNGSGGTQLIENFPNATINLLAACATTNNYSTPAWGRAVGIGKFGPQELRECCFLDRRQQPEYDLQRCHVRQRSVGQDRQRIADPRGIQHLYRGDDDRERCTHRRH